MTFDVLSFSIMSLTEVKCKFRNGRVHRLFGAIPPEKKLSCHPPKTFKFPRDASQTYLLCALRTKLRKFAVTSLKLVTPGKWLQLICFVPATKIENNWLALCGIHVIIFPICGQPRRKIACAIKKGLHEGRSLVLFYFVVLASNFSRFCLASFHFTSSLIQSFFESLWVSRTSTKF